MSTFGLPSIVNLLPWWQVNVPPTVPSNQPTMPSTSSSRYPPMHPSEEEEPESERIQAWKNTWCAPDPELEFTFEDLISGLKIIHDKLAHFSLRTALLSHLWAVKGSQATNI